MFVVRSASRSLISELTRPRNYRQYTSRWVASSSHLFEDSDSGLNSEYASIIAQGLGEIFFYREKQPNVFLRIPVAYY